MLLCTNALIFKEQLTLHYYLFYQLHIQRCSLYAGVTTMPWNFKILGSEPLPQINTKTSPIQLIQENILEPFWFIYICICLCFYYYVYKLNHIENRCFHFKVNLPVFQTELWQLPYYSVFESFISLVLWCRKPFFFLPFFFSFQSSIWKWY